MGRLGAVNREPSTGSENPETKALLRRITRCLDRLNTKAMETGKWVDVGAFLRALRDTLSDYRRRDNSEMPYPGVDYPSLMRQAITAARASESRFNEARSPQEVILACYELTSAYVRMDLIAHDAGLRADTPTFDRIRAKQKSHGNCRGFISKVGARDET